MNRAEEDYIKTIYELTVNLETDLIKNITISESLGFSVQSVNEMVKKLSAKEFLNFIPYKGVMLTPKGYNEAVRLIRAHRVWEVFLMEKLGYSWIDVHEQAEQLEHSASDELIEKLYEYIGKPVYCSHGNPVPNYDGKLAPIYNKSLTSFNVSESFTLKRVLDNKKLLMYLSENNININNIYEVLEKDTYSEYIKVLDLNNDNELIITNKIASLMYGV